MHTVLCATDGSVGADEALREAGRYCVGPDARLIVLHVERMVAGAAYGTLPLVPADIQALGTAAREGIQKQIERANVQCRAVDVEVVTATGAVYAEIVRRAEEARADLVVVGGQGGSGLARIFLGSVAKKVVRYAHAPVLVARAATKRGQVVAATDLSERARPTLAAAAEEAARRDARLTVARLLDAPSEGMALRRAAVPGPASREERLRRARQDLEREVQAAGVRAELVVEEGDPVTSIVRLADELAAELVVVGATGRTGLRRLVLGSVAGAVAARAACSVLVVRKIAT
jgi:nucleotide-binding universal stress UspA family protein